MIKDSIQVAIWLIDREIATYSKYEDQPAIAKYLKEVRTAKHSLSQCH